MWGCATLNEVRKYETIGLSSNGLVTDSSSNRCLDLPSHKTFEDITSDAAVAAKLKAVYDHPDLVELYTGASCEHDGTQPSQCIAYTGTRLFLADLVSTVRGVGYMMSAVLFLLLTCAP